MKWPGKSLVYRGILFALGLAVPLWAAEGLSTTFGDVMAGKIPLGIPHKIVDQNGRGLVLRNLGDHPVRIRIEVLQPSRDQLRAGAIPISNVRWVKVLPAVVDIAPHAERECDIRITLPRDAKFHKNLYQAMLWSHGIPLDGSGMTVSAGLLSRLRFIPGP